MKVLGDEPEGDVNLALVPVDATIGNFSQRHRASQAAGLERSVRQGKVRQALLRSYLGLVACADTRGKFVVLQRQQARIGVVELEVVGPHAFTAEELGRKRLEAITRRVLEDTPIVDGGAIVEVKHNRLSVAVAGTVERA